MAQRRGRVVSPALAALVAAVLAVSTVTIWAPAAIADPDDAFPSKEQVDAAKDDVADKAREVGRIKAELLMANQRLVAAATRAEKASEEYNGAMWRLDQANAALKQARAEAAQARRTVADQRDAIGALAARSYRQGAELSTLNAMFSVDGPEAVLDHYAAYQGASTSMEADWQRYAAADALAQVFERKAAQAREEQSRVAAEAEAAKERAAATAREAQQTAGRIAGQKDQLIRELADAQNISVKLARQRQAALEELARQRAAEQARQEALAKAKAEAKARAKAEAEAAAAAKRAAEKRAAEERAREKATERERQREQNRQHNNGPAPRPQPQPAEPSPQPTPAPPPPPPPAPSPNGGAQQAIAFARAQVGEPYRWGAAGPSSWDCSGLTMVAWGTAGVSLPHYSVAQYYAGTPISASELRPGDLVFWSSSSSPGGIHHVALYMGDGMIVHAPRTGRPVAVESMYYWIPPTHFARP